MKAVKLNPAEVKNILLAYKASDDGNKIFGVLFERKNKKCLACDKSSKALNKHTHCPKCGDELSTQRLMSARFGVTNPKNDTAPGQGAYEGESFEEALSKGRLKVFDGNAQGKYGQGGYRQFYWENVLALQIKGVEYVIKH